MVLNANTLITLSQAMQLVALAPCIFVIAFLLATSRDYRLIIVPCLYFLTLAVGFLLPLTDLWPDWLMQDRVSNPFHILLMFVPSLLPAFSFLLILQFATGDTPRPGYWLILTLPLVGGGGMVYAALLSEEVCLQTWGCMPSADIEALYATFSNAVIFLLLVAIFARTRHHRGELEMGRGAEREMEQSRNEYWLIVALIGLNLLSTAVALVRVQGVLAAEDALFIHTVLRMTFIYVVLTLLFRVFDHGRPVVVQPTESRSSSAREKRDRDIVAAFEALMQERHFYREMGCNRESMARELGVTENALSRVVNQHYGARFTDIVNRYRVKEAQHLLLAEPEKPVTDVAFEVGFNSIPSFNRVFKGSCGFSPSAFRATRLNRRGGK